MLVHTAGIALPVPAADGSYLKATINQTDDPSLNSTPLAAVPQTTSPAAPSIGATPTTSTSETPPKTAAVTLTFTGPTSIKVIDSTGALILQRKLRKGDTRVLTGTPPYSFTIGNVGVVRLTVGDRPINLADHTQGKAARFTFDPRAPE